MKKEAVLIDIMGMKQVVHKDCARLIEEVFGEKGQIHILKDVKPKSSDEKCWFCKNKLSEEPSKKAQNYMEMYGIKYKKSVQKKD